MENFILTLLLLVIGFALKRVKAFPESSSQVLNLFVIYISLPALVLLKIPQLRYSNDLLVTLIVPWLVLAFSAFLVLVIGKRLKWPRETTGALLLLVPLGNTSFLGIPMVQAFFGEKAVPVALMYDQLGSFLALALYGSLILMIYSEKKTQLSYTSVINKIISFPPFISLVLALFLMPVSLPPLYFKTLTPLASTLVPVVMIAVGMQLSLKLELNKIAPFVIGLSIKMILAPLIVISAFILLGLHGQIYQVTVFEAAMPPMISAGALAIMSNLSPKLTAAMVAYGILLAFVSLPIVYFITQMKI